MNPPAVQDLSALIGQYQTALKPQSDQLDTQIAANDTSGTAQAAGLEAKKTTAFGDITQQANDRGGYFSGFSPDAEAKYTAGTYLPALAQLQDTIATTRSALLGKKADLSASANTAALGERQTEEAALTKYNADRQAAAEAQAEAERNRQFTAGQNALDRAASVAAANAKAAGLTPAQQQQQDTAAAHNFLQQLTGSDNRVSPQSYAQAKSLWTSLGYSGQQFDQEFSAYRNPNNKNYKLG